MNTIILHRFEIIEDITGSLGPLGRGRCLLSDVMLEQNVSLNLLPPRSPKSRSEGAEGCQMLTFLLRGGVKSRTVIEIVDYKIA